MVLAVTRSSIVFALFSCAILHITVHQAATAGSRRSVLQLLLVLNLQQGPMEEWVPSWDKGFEILPAAHLAVDRINSDPNILPGYHLELLKVATGPCTPNFHIEALLNFVRHTSRQDQHIVGVVGLFCTSVTQLISPLAGHRGFSLLQISGSASPVLRNKNKYSYLWHMVPSSAVYVQTMLGLMRHYGWRRVAVIGDRSIQGDAYHFHTTESFLLQAAAYSNMSQPLEATLIVPGPQFIKRLQMSGHKIIFVSVNLRTAIEILCQAYKEGLMWPDYAWILYDYQIDDFMFYSGEFCGMDSVAHALEGVFLLQHKLSLTGPDINQWNYSRDYQTNVSNNSYAQVLYYTLWGFTLALNNVANHLQSRNMSLEDELLGNRESFTQMVNFELMHSKLWNNKELHTHKHINILRITHRTVEQVGSFNSLSGQMSLDGNLSGEFPNDEIPRIYRFLPFAAVLFLSIVSGMCIALTTIVLLLFIYYRNAAEIKATSPKLSLFMFVGSYLLLGTTLALITISALVNHGRFICSAVAWSACLGLNFIFATLLVRMLRIYRVFTYFGKLGKRWSDGVLCVVMLSIVGVEAVLLLVWTLVDAYTIQDVEIFQTTANQPYYEVVQFCSSYYVRTWLPIVLSEIGVLMLLVALLAYKTRKIRRKHFKDTKKVNSYIFMNILLICVAMSQWWVLRTNNYPAASLITVYISYGGSAVLCQILLFIPKVMPPLVRHLFQRTSKDGLEKPILTRQYSQDKGTLFTQKSYLDM